MGTTTTTIVGPYSVWAHDDCDHAFCRLWREQVAAAQPAPTTPALGLTVKGGKRAYRSRTSYEYEVHMDDGSDGCQTFGPYDDLTTAIEVADDLAGDGVPYTLERVSARAMERYDNGDSSFVDWRVIAIRA